MSESNTFHKNTITMRISAEMMFGMRAQKFPRRGHTIVHPLTSAERAQYADLKKRWKAAEKQFDQIVAEAEHRGWGESSGGYDHEPARMRPLEPRREWVADETAEDHRARVEANYAHHEKTGEWLEEPAKDIWSMINQTFLPAWNSEGDGTDG